MSSYVYTRFTAPVLATPRTTDPEAIRAFDLLSKAIGSLAIHPLLDGVLIQGVVLPNAVDFTIEHHLGRPWRGWFETNRVAATSAANTIRETTLGLDKKYFLVLNSSNSITIDLWVF